MLALIKTGWEHRNGCRTEICVCVVCVVYVLSMECHHPNWKYPDTNHASYLYSFFEITIEYFELPIPKIFQFAEARNAKRVGMPRACVL